MNSDIGKSLLYIANQRENLPFNEDYLEGHCKYDQLVNLERLENQIVKLSVLQTKVEADKDAVQILEDLRQAIAREQTRLAEHIAMYQGWIDKPLNEDTAKLHANTLETLKEMANILRHLPVLGVDQEDGECA